MASLHLERVALKQHCRVSVLQEIYTHKTLLQAGNVSRPPLGYFGKLMTHRAHMEQGETRRTRILMVTSMTYFIFQHPPVTAMSFL